MPVELQAILNNENKDKIYTLMGYSRQDYLKFLDQFKYLKKHGMSTKAQENQYKNADFSRKFFQIID